MNRKKFNIALIAVSRWLGRMICRVRGHNYYYPGGAYDSFCAYGCIRCGELDRPLESLPATVRDEFGDWPEVDFNDSEEFEHARRWVPFLSYPRWI